MDRNCRASVSIVNKDGVPVYEAFVPPPRNYDIIKTSRPYCPISDQQFLIIRGCEGTDLKHVCREVLDILQRIFKENFLAVQIVNSPLLDFYSSYITQITW